MTKSSNFVSTSWLVYIILCLQCCHKFHAIAVSTPPFYTVQLEIHCPTFGSRSDVCTVLRWQCVCVKIVSDIGNQLMAWLHADNMHSCGGVAALYYNIFPASVSVHKSELEIPFRKSVSVSIALSELSLVAEQILCCLPGLRLLDETVSQDDEVDMSDGRRRNVPQNVSGSSTVHFLQSHAKSPPSMQSGSALQPVLPVQNLVRSCAARERNTEAERWRSSSSSVPSLNLSLETLA
eukprot:337644-Amphidinium_carterae.1